MRTARYRAVPPKIDCRRSIEGEIGSIEGEKGKKKKRKRKKRREEENLSPVLARAPSSRRRPRITCARRRRHPREETERLSARGERSRQHRPFL
ncbi:hypothetical protein B296_00052606 [Ensete ventricosum]|uniref:Uncharacterized protein n=1 Tax=Ensete ventricosum TaxID=4639 RepID=A0A426Y8T2_ENSVE|nr:hypothetical protein B296_00052606 [Ensete ventricosum]